MACGETFLCDKAPHPPPELCILEASSHGSLTLTQYQLGADTRKWDLLVNVTQSHESKPSRAFTDELSNSVPDFTSLWEDVATCI